MERLFRERMEYISGAAGAECFICAAASSQDDTDLLVLTRGSDCLVLMNKYPYNSGHLLIAPSRHFGDVGEITEEESRDVMRLLKKCVSILETEMKAEGFNFGANLGAAAGAGVPDHIHFHVVPRWNGDTNFMPVVADSKVLPEPLERTFDRLRKRFDMSGEPGPT